jgi:hypothetical protein
MPPTSRESVARLIFVYFDFRSIKRAGQKEKQKRGLSEVKRVWQGDRAYKAPVPAQLFSKLNTQLGRIGPLLGPKGEINKHGLPVMLMCSNLRNRRFDLLGHLLVCLK